MARHDSSKLFGGHGKENKCVGFSTAQLLGPRSLLSCQPLQGRGEHTSCTMPVVLSNTHHALLPWDFEKPTYIGERGSTSFPLLHGTDKVA